MIVIASVVWLCLATSMVYGTTITISSNGSNESDCCYSKRGGNCLCNSLSSALNHMQDDTTINIVSDITLNVDDVEILQNLLARIYLAAFFLYDCIEYIPMGSCG